METLTSRELLGDWGEFVAEHLGLAFPPARLRDLERGIVEAARSIGHSHIGLWLEALRHAPRRRDLAALAAHLTVGETYFFRDPSAWRSLAQDILPDLIRDREPHRELRFWSAGCATGEEPYTLAILLDCLIPRDAGWRVSILATDINAAALTRARTARYSEWSFRGAPAWIRNAYFSKRPGGRHELAPRIRKTVSFATLNLADAAAPRLEEPFDLVLCRNVLMYFDSVAERRAVRLLRGSMRRGGWLLVSPCELSASLFSEFSMCYRNGAAWYRNSPSQARWKHPSFAPREAPEPGQIGLRLAAPVAPATASNGESASAGAREEQPSAAPAGPPLSRTPLPDAAKLARRAANAGRLEEALALAAQAIEQEKLCPAHHYLQAVILDEMGRPGEAVAALRRAVYLDRKFVLAHVALLGLAACRHDLRERDRCRKVALALLQDYKDDEIVPETGGMTAARLANLIAAGGMEA